MPCSSLIPGSVCGSLAHNTEKKRKFQLTKYQINSYLLVQCPYHPFHSIPYPTSHILSGGRFLEHWVEDVHGMLDRCIPRDCFVPMVESEI